LVVWIVSAVFVVAALVALSRLRVPAGSATQRLSRGDAVRVDIVSTKTLPDRVRLDCILSHPARGGRGYSFSTNLRRPRAVESLKALDGLAGNPADVEFGFAGGPPRVAISMSGRKVTYPLAVPRAGEIAP